MCFDTLFTLSQILNLTCEIDKVFMDEKAEAYSQAHI